MQNHKNRKQSEKEFLSVIPEAMPDFDDQQSIPLRETAFLTLRKLILTEINFCWYVINEIVHSMVYFAVFIVA
jgi:hypothetical protein